MKTTSTFTLALTLAVSLLAVEARAGGFGRSMGGRSASSFSSQASRSYYAVPSRNTNVATAQNFQGSNKFAQVNKPNPVNAKPPAGKPSLDEGSSNSTKDLAKFDFGKGMKSKWFPGKSWWSCGGGSAGAVGADAGLTATATGPGTIARATTSAVNTMFPPTPAAVWPTPPTTAAAPVTPADDAESTPPPADSTPDSAAKIARIVNPAEQRDHARLCRQRPNLFAGGRQDQEVKLADGTFIEFDRGSENSTGRYALARASTVSPPRRKAGSFTWAGESALDRLRGVELRVDRQGR